MADMLRYRSRVQVITISEIRDMKRMVEEHLTYRSIARWCMVSRESAIKS